MNLSACCPPRHRDEASQSAGQSPPNVSRLKQLKKSLQNKIEILSALDEQILKLVESDQVETEADLVQEKAELATLEAF